jgi:hypothetical protein
MIRRLQPHTRRILKDLALLLGTSLFVRALFLIIVPMNAVSWDIHSWTRIVELLRQHENPYHRTPNLNWPPFWMQILYGVSAVSDATHVSITRCIQTFLIFIESLTIVVSYFTLSHYFPKVNARTSLLWGMALNPISILLTCQHGNFDILVAFWIGLAVYMLLSFKRSGTAVDWLWASALIGLGILTKTVPVVLFPILFYGIRSLSLRTRLLGYLLIIGPALLGLSVLFVLTPRDILVHVINYRSEPGLFGMTGLLRFFGAFRAISIYSTIFPFFLIGLCGIWARKMTAASSDLPNRTLILLPAFLLMVAPGAGPGYAPQYLYWFLPLLAISYPLYGRSWQRFLLAAYGIVSIVYVLEYGFRYTYGFSLMYFVHSPEITRFSQSISTQATPTFVIRLPIFAAYVLLLVQSCRLILKDFRDLDASHRSSV